MKNIAALFCVAFLALLFNSCNSSTVTFEDNSSPGKRDYVWTIIDSIGGNLSLSKIWGDSPDNIWLSGGFAINPSERLWHYDGVKFKAVCPSDIYPYGVFGFGINNMLAASNASIWRFNGTAWNKEFTAEANIFQANSALMFFDITGNDPNNIWAVGRIYDYTNVNEYGIIYQNKGIGWSRRYITNDKNVAFYKIFPGYSDNQCFIWGARDKFNPWVDSSAVWEYDGKTLKQIHVGLVEDLENGCALNKINGIVYITIGHKIYRYYAGQLYEYLNVTQPDFVMAVYGRNEKDLFLWAREGLLHYNGTDVQYVYKPGWPIYINEKVLLFDKEIYICAQNTNNRKYYFIKGVLPDKQ